MSGFERSNKEFARKRKGLPVAAAPAAFDDLPGIAGSSAVARSLEGPNWVHVFGECNDRCGTTPLPFKRTDVAVIYLQTVLPDGEDFRVLGLLHSGLYFAIAAGCAYTGWDVGGENSAELFETYEAFRRGITNADRIVLGIVVDD